MSMISIKRRQAGTVLVIGMLMLVMMTLLALTSFNLGRGEYQIISNMQFQGEAASAAQMTLEQVVSSLRFAQSPATVFPVPCPGQEANTQCYGDVVVKIKSRSDSAKPVCIIAKTVKNVDLDLTKEIDLGCSSGVSQTFGVQGAVSGNSLCADSTWDVQAEAVDSITQAKATITTGLSVRVSTDDIATSCP